MDDSRLVFPRLFLAVPGSRWPAARRCGGTAVLALMSLTVAATPASALDFAGTVQFDGTVSFESVIPGIASEDVIVSVSPETESTGSGEKCSVTATSSDGAGALGAWPSSGEVSAGMLLERGGPQAPEGSCVLTLRAEANDGVATSARGSATVFVPAATIDASGSLSIGNIVLRQSKAIAGVDSECAKWVKKTLKLRAKCNDTILARGGAEAAAKCRDAGPEPADCDPGDQVEAILAMSYGGNDQQDDPLSGQGVDASALKAQVSCQKYIGKSVAGFAAKRVKAVGKKCVEAGIDDDSCRSNQTNAVKKKLDNIAKCAADQATDDATGRVVAQVGAPCDACISAGSIDTKCLRSCFETAVAELTDSIVGDVPECGNGILQSGEFCDDGNLDNGDCCSDSCTVEAGGVEGPNGDATCSDALDNDCDGDIDAADVDCQ